jgi:hypothetical protein
MSQSRISTLLQATLRLWFLAALGVAALPQMSSVQQADAATVASAAGARQGWTLGASMLLLSASQGGQEVGGPGDAALQHREVQAETVSTGESFEIEKRTPAPVWAVVCVGLAVVFIPVLLFLRARSGRRKE